MLTLLLYVLIVGLVAAVLFLAAGAVFGRAEELGPLPEGTTATVLPAEGITGTDVRALRFQQVVRGYKAAEVDWALARLAARIDELQQQLDRAQSGYPAPGTVPAVSHPPTGEYPAYRTGEHKAYSTGEYPAYRTGEYRWAPAGAAAQATPRQATPAQTAPGQTAPSQTAASQAAQSQAAADPAAADPAAADPAAAGRAADGGPAARPADPGERAVPGGARPAPRRVGSTDTPEAR